MKRISLILITAMLIMNFSCFAPVFAQEDALPQVDETAAGLLAALEIVAIPEEAEEYTAEVTRADFAVYVAAMLKIDGYAISEERYYTDVPMDHWGLAAINELTERGILSGYMGKFRPSDIITAEEAVKVLAKVLGYTESDIYPGSIPKNVSNDLLIGVTNKNGRITLGDAVVLLYNALRADLLTTFIVGPDFHQTKTDGNLLGLFYDLYEASGIVTEVYGISTDGNPAGDIETVRIENQRFKCDIAYNLNKHLGRYVEAYYFDNGDSVPRIELIFNQSDRVKEAVFDIEDFGGFNPSTRTISYYSAEKDKAASVVVPKNTVYLKNGKDVTASLSTCFKNLTQGTIEVVVSDKYSVVIIREYVNSVIGHISAETMKTYDKYDTKCIFDLKPEPGKYIGIWNRDGQPIEFGDILAGSILSVCSSKDYFDVYVSDRAITGDISKITVVDGKKILTVDEVQYKPDAQLPKTDRMKTVKSGQSLTLYLDMFGRIADVSKAVETDLVYGYIMDCAVYDNDFDSVFKVKILTAQNEKKVFECADKTKIDGDIKQGALAQETALKQGNSGTKAKHQVVRYRLSKDGKVSEIDTIYPGEKETAGNRLERIRKKETAYYDNRAANLGKYVLMDAETIIFGVPGDEDKDNNGIAEIDEANEKEFGKAVKKDLTHGGTYTIDTYQTDVQSGAADVVLVFDDLDMTKGTMNLASLFLVEEVMSVYDPERDTVKVVSGMAEGVKKQYRVDEDYDPSALGAGDLIALSLNGNEEIVDVSIKYYDFAAKTPVSKSTSTTGNWKNWDVDYGYVKYLDGNIITMSAEIGGSTSQVADISGVPVTVYDSRGVNPVCRAGSITDIAEAKNSNGLIYICRRFVAPVSIAVYLPKPVGN